MKAQKSIEFVKRVIPAHSVPSEIRVIVQEVAIDTPPATDQADHLSTGLLLHPTISLPLLNMIDMFSVSLVVPLLFQYYKHAGVTNANHREMLSSVFSISQILGGLILGAMADVGVIQRRSILFLSFLGSALAYSLIIFGGLYALIFSRVLVGLVKQTMTVTTTLMARYTTNETRAKHMGRLSASSTAAWIVGVRPFYCKHRSCGFATSRQRRTCRRNYYRCKTQAQNILCDEPPSMLFFAIPGICHCLAPPVFLVHTSHVICYHGKLL
jgi:Major Facilitator Superfamily